MENSFVIGDEVYHKALSSQIWVIEEIDGNKLYCSTLMQGTLEKKLEWFSKDSISKVVPAPSISFASNRKRSNYW